MANTGKNNLENKPVSFSRPKRLFKLLRRVTVIIGNELDNVRTGNKARKYRRKSTGQTSPISNTGKSDAFQKDIKFPSSPGWWNQIVNFVSFQVLDAFDIINLNFLQVGF